MLLTEQQAKTKWCPHARVIRWETTNEPDRSTDHLIGGVNRDALGRTKNPGSCRCIAGECMAWRWESVESWNKRPAQPLPMDDALCEPDTVSWRHGYCGLSGRPE